MSINKTYAVFGLGRYGLSVAKELVNNGAEVIAVDSNESIVNTVSTELPFCKCADTTDAEVLNIRQRYVSESVSQIYEDYKHLYSFSGFKKIVNGTTFKNVPIYNKQQQL